MAGHSKWAQIKRSKAVKDARRGQTFAQGSREIIMAAKLGGGDPEGNFRLRTAIARAKASGMPGDTIKRAIEKGCGVGGGDQLEEMNYEGYGPAGVAIFIEAVTDNRNRTAGDIRSYFNKYDGNLGADGCVAWIFEQRGVIRLPKDSGSDERIFEAAVEAGALDVQSNPDENEPDAQDAEASYEIFTDPAALNAVAQSLAAQGFSILSADVMRLPQNTVAVSDEAHARPLLKLLDALEAHDDVQQVYANAAFDDAVLAALE